MPVEGHYSLSFELDGCTVYFGSYDFSTAPSEVTTVHVQGGDAHLTSRQVPASVCGYQISGRLIASDSTPLGGVYIAICQLAGEDCATWLVGNTDDNGAFAIRVPQDGVYRISFGLDGCAIYFRRGGLTTNRNEQGTVTISGRNIRLNPRQIPADMCMHRISGRFIDSSGAPLSKKWIYVHWPGGLNGALTNADGRFKVRIPSDGAYTFSIQPWNPNCSPSLSGTALGSPDNPVRVNDADVTGITLHLPGTVEALCE